LGLHNIIFNRQFSDAQWNQVIQTVKHLRRRFDSIHTTQMNTKVITTQSEIFVGIYSAIVRSLLMDESFLKPSLVKNASSCDPATLDINRVHQCIELRNHMLNNRKKINRLVNKFIVVDMALSKYLSNRISTLINGLMTLESFQLMFEENKKNGSSITDDCYFFTDPAWVWTWATFLDFPETIDVIQTFIESDDDQCALNSNLIQLKQTMKSLGGIQNILNERDKVKNDILDGNTIVTKFPSLAGSPMSDAIFAHKLWCSMRKVGNGKKLWFTKKGKENFMKGEHRDALKWLQEVYVPSIEA
jgi:hypothetical protein